MVQLKWNIPIYIDRTSMFRALMDRMVDQNVFDLFHDDCIHFQTIQQKQKWMTGLSDWVKNFKSGYKSDYKQDYLGNDEETFYNK